ncbi:hypothetical protein ACHAW6_005810 [Cyclotella cf. meneghiniana]
MSLERSSLSDPADSAPQDLSSLILHNVAPSHIKNNDACIESIVQEAIVMADAEHHENGTLTTTSSIIDHSHSPKKSTQSQVPQLGLHSYHHSNSIDNGSTNTEQFVSMLDIFALLRTAELESRLNPVKASRLRHVIMEGGNGACPGGTCCWMNVVFGVLCELIPAPAYAVDSISAGSLGRCSSDGAAHEAFREASSPMRRRFYGPPMLTDQQHSGSPSNEIAMRLPDESISHVKHTMPVVSEMLTREQTQCKPCTKSDSSPSAYKNKAHPEKDDAVAALLDMKMSSHDSTDNEFSPRKKRKAPTSEPSLEAPHEIPATAAIYPHPFPPLKNPSLYRRTRCKAPSCPNNGSACPYHGHDIKICKISECTNRAVQGGVCSKHGARRPMCRVEGCTNQSKREGRCIKHGAVLGGCGREGCRNQARSGGFKLNNEFEWSASLAMCVRSGETPSMKD